MDKLILFSVLLLPLALASPFGHIFRQPRAVYKPPLGDDPGEPLFLTPYVMKGDFATGEFGVWREKQRCLMHVVGCYVLLFLLYN